MPMNVLPGDGAFRYEFVCPKTGCHETLSLAVEPDELVFCETHREPMERVGERS